MAKVLLQLSGDTSNSLHRIASDTEDRHPRVHLRVFHETPEGEWGEKRLENRLNNMNLDSCWSKQISLKKNKRILDKREASC